MSKREVHTSFPIGSQYCVHDKAVEPTDWKAGSGKCILYLADNEIISVAYPQSWFGTPFGTLYAR